MAMGGVVLVDQEVAAARWGRRIAELSGHVHSAMAELVTLAAEFNSLEGWIGCGYRSFPHWLTVNCGFDYSTGNEILRVAHALEELPLIRRAFEEGQLSFDKVRAVTRVATAEEDQMWRDIALGAAGHQLLRICNSIERTQMASAQDQAREQHIRRSLRTQWLENGMLHVMALLPPEDGKLLLEAVAAAMPPDAEPATSVNDGALDPWSARREDALMLVLHKGLGTMQAQSAPIAARHQVVVHVDFELLTGMTERGRCFLEDGPPIALATLERIGCGAEVVAMIERNGKILDVRPGRRYPTVRQRRAIIQRDGTCLFPGCHVPARDCEPHHTRPWALSHRTLVDEQGSLCLYHHHRLHDGAFDMIQAGPGKFRFETPWGRPIPPSPVAVNPLTGGSAHLEQRTRGRGIAIDWNSAGAGGAGEAFDLHLAVETYLGNTHLRQMERKPPPRPGPSVALKAPSASGRVRSRLTSRRSPPGRRPGAPPGSDRASS